MKSFLSYLNDTADRLPDKLAFSDGAFGLTFRELRQAACSIGACLRNGGAEAEPVGVLMERGLVWAAEGKQYALDHGLTTERFENTAKMY